MAKSEFIPLTPTWRDEPQPVPPPVSAGPSEEPALPPAMRPRRQKRASGSLSMTVSVLFHIGLVAALGTVVWHTASPSTVGPAVSLSFENPGDGPLSAGSTGAPVVSSALKLDVPVGEGSLEPLMSTPALTDEPATLRGLTSAPSDDSTLTSRLGAIAGSSLASGSLFGSAMQAATGGVAVAGIGDGQNAVTFGGLGAQSVNSVVYVVDCSGPMVTSLPMVLAELERSVSRLSPSQRFGVILFRSRGDSVPAAESFAPTLVRATPSARQLLHDWLAAVEPAGRSSPLAGLEAALALKPDAVFLLSRAIQRSGGGLWDGGLRATMARLDQLNPRVSGSGRRTVLIQTIQFLEEDPTGIMQAIGTEHGQGSGYRVVKRQQDLNAPTGSGRSPADQGTAGASDR